LAQSGRQVRLRRCGLLKPPALAHGLGGQALTYVDFSAAAKERRGDEARGIAAATKSFR